MKIITFEEHYLCPETDAAYRRLVDQSQMEIPLEAKEKIAHMNGEKLLGL